MRKLTLEQAQAAYPQRYTMEHKPAWAEQELKTTHYYAPHYVSDQEWYDNTVFPGEFGVHGNSQHCESSNQSWPMGQTLTFPFRVERVDN